MTAFKNPILSLLLASIFFTSCNGQVKKAPPNEVGAKQISFTSKNTKLTKTQGTDKFQNLHCIIQDKEGNLWFGTTGEGVYRYDGKEFTQFTEKDGLSNNSVWSMIEDRLGNIWFGTDDGVSQYNGKSISKIILPMTAPIGLGKAMPQSVKNTIWSMMQDKDGIIWIGTDNGVYNYNGRYFSYILNNTDLANKTGLTLKSIQCMFQGKNGNIWFGSGPQASEGIILFDGKSLTNFKPQNEGWIRNITEDRNGALLFATRHNGLITYNGKAFSGFSQPQNLRKDLLNNVLVDSKGNIWYGSDYTNSTDVTTGGLWKFDGRSVVEFTKRDGLGNTAIYSLAEDKAGNIWIGTRNCGLYRYNGQTFETFSE
ncbi:MAG TPA: two-component regulator propeller domain-containing protein [Chitinophagaceae bacterium]|nr:two-component regulator propeller domain-containing protein [Chitinophagaceae bacterium]